VHREVGIAAVLCASLVGVSTLFTKQHYIADVIAGILLAVVAYAIFLRRHTRDKVAELDRRLAPAVTLLTAAIAGVGLACFWVFYLLTGQR
jgi:membrane-associated phospholipid phosphatase